MMKDKTYRILPLVLLIVTAFLIGFIAEDVGASRGSVSELSSRLQRLPDRFKDLIDPPEPGVELPVLQTYYEVLGRLRDGYYAEKAKDRAKVDDIEMTYNAIRGMLQSLDDPYTRFLDREAYMRMREENEGNFVGIGAQLQVNKDQQVFIKEPLPNSPAEKANVKAGDIIVRVDGKPIAGLDIDEVVKKIRGDEGTKVTLSLVRGENREPIEVTIVRRLVEFQIVRSKMLDEKNGIGYIRLYQFSLHSDEQLESAMRQLEKQGLTGLILDLRRNPGGLLDVAVQIGSRFIDGGPVVIIEERSGRRTPYNADRSKRNRRAYPLVVLVDGESASASEIVAGAVQDNKTGTIVGANTFGKARVQTVSALRNMTAAIAITTAKYLTPAGRDINKVGVKPDVVIEAPDVTELGDPADDVQLARAIEVMKEKLHIADAKPTVAKREPAKSKG